MEQLTRTLRKRIVNSTGSTRREHPGQDAIDIISTATVIVTSEDPAHPIENIFDNAEKAGGSRWIAADAGEQYIILDFDSPQTIHKIALTIEEPDTQRTQELTVSISADGGKTYQEVIRQQYNFSPPGTTWERETWTLPATKASCLRLDLLPDKNGKPCRATISSLLLY
jgi:F5/8 type C domain-containing protein